MALTSEYWSETGRSVSNSGNSYKSPEWSVGTAIEQAIKVAQDQLVSLTDFIVHPQSTITISNWSFYTISMRWNNPTRSAQTVAGSIKGVTCTWLQDSPSTRVAIMTWLVIWPCWSVRWDSRPCYFQSFGYVCVQLTITMLIYLDVACRFYYVHTTRH